MMTDKMIQLSLIPKNETMYVFYGYHLPLEIHLECQTFPTTTKKKLFRRWLKWTYNFTFVSPSIGLSMCLSVWQSGACDTEISGKAL